MVLHCIVVQYNALLRIPKYSKFVEYSKILQLNTELGFVRSLVKHITLVWANGTSVNHSIILNIIITDYLEPGLLLY